MALGRQHYITRILDGLAFLQTKVRIFSRLNLLDVNVHSENFYRDFLNIVLDYNLENINFSDPNSASIDLGDPKAKIAIQVTSTSALKKTKDTVKGFVKKNLHKTYTRLVIVNILEKAVHKVDKVGDATNYQLDTKSDIIDLNDINKIIMNMDIDKLKVLDSFIEKNIHMGIPPKLAREVQTFMRLIEVLSDENHPSIGSGFITEPDPNGKINERFFDYAEFLKSEYTRLYEDYGKVQEEAIGQVDLGTTKIRRLGESLRVFSDSILAKNAGNPKAALEEMIKHYSTQLSTMGVEYENRAIEFFLISQIIKCNVFPNKESVKYV